jgi:ElaB/YqjD/DUF883 family membrane-anchored ribosome-binding protein
MRANGLAPRTQRSTKDLVKEISVLKSQLKKLSSAMEADASENVNGAISAIQIKSRAAVDDAIEAATSFIEEQTDNARELADSAVDKAAELGDSAAETLIKTVKERPMTTLAAVVGIGFLAGLLCRRP